MTQERLHHLKWTKVGSFQHWDANGWTIRRKGAWFIISSKDDVRLSPLFVSKHDRLRSAQMEIEKHRREAVKKAEEKQVS